MIPETIPFERVTAQRQTRDCFWEKVGFRKPKKGEYYVSGAIPMAYKAPNDLPFEYIVVRPTYYAETKTVMAKGEKVELCG